MVEELPPVVEELPPVVEELPPVVEETPPVEEELNFGVEELNPWEEEELTQAWVKLPSGAVELWSCLETGLYYRGEEPSLGGEPQEPSLGGRRNCCGRDAFGGQGTAPPGAPPGAQHRGHDTTGGTTGGTTTAGHGTAAGRGACTEPRVRALWDPGRGSSWG